MRWVQKSGVVGLRGAACGRVLGGTERGAGSDGLGLTGAESGWVSLNGAECTMGLSDRVTVRGEVGGMVGGIKAKCTGSGRSGITGAERGFSAAA